MLKAAHLDSKAKALIEVIRDNPYQTPPSYEKLDGDLQALYFLHRPGRNSGKLSYCPPSNFSPSRSTTPLEGINLY